MNTKYMTVNGDPVQMNIVKGYIAISKEGNAPFSTTWEPGMLNGVMVIRGAWADGSPLTAIPNYARLNRPVSRLEDNLSPTSIVWLRK